MHRGILSQTIGHVNEYPTMHYFGNPRHTQSMIAYKILTEFFWKSGEKLECGIVVDMPFYFSVIVVSTLKHVVVISLAGITVRYLVTPPSIY